MQQRAWRTSFGGADLDVKALAAIFHWFGLGGELVVWGGAACWSPLAGITTHDLQTPG